MIEKIERAAAQIGAEIFRDGRLNIWGIRTPRGEFNDWFYLFYFKDGVLHETPLLRGTTEPGQGWLWKVMGNPTGTASLCANQQYVDCWKIGKHKGKYDALIQSEKAKFIVVRDANQNGVIDYNNLKYTDVRGLNFHTTKLNYLRNFIGKFSAGCQVCLLWDQYWSYAWPMIKECRQEFYSYTLIEEALCV